MNTRPLPRRDVYLTNPEVLEAFEFAAQADAPNTQRAYLADWKHFIEWCKTRHRCPLPVRPTISRSIFGIARRSLGSRSRPCSGGCRPSPRLMLAMAILRRPANGLCETP